MLLLLHSLLLLLLSLLLLLLPLSLLLLLLMLMLSWTLYPQLPPPVVEDVPGVSTKATRRQERRLRRGETRDE